MDAKEKLKHIEQQLDKYQDELGLNLSNSVKNKASEILSLQEKDLYKLTPKECVIKSYILRRYAIEIQKAYNRNFTYMKWASNAIDREISQQIDESGESDYTPYKYRRQQAIKKNEYAWSLEKIRNTAELRISELSMLAKQIEAIASTLDKLRFNKED